MDGVDEANTGVIVGSAEEEADELLNEEEAAQKFDDGFTDEEDTSSRPTESATLPAEVTTPAPEAQGDLAPEYVQVTAEDLAQIKAAILAIEDLKEKTAHATKVSDTATGQYGELSRTLANLRAATPLGQSVEVSDADFEEMREDFPELAQMQAKGLKRIFSKMTGTAGQAPVIDDRAIDARVEARFEVAQEQYAREQLAWMQPEWEDIVGPPNTNTEYRQWLATQPEEYQRKMNDTNSPYAIDTSIKQFQADTQATPKAQAASRSNRFKAAVQPRGAGGVASKPGRSDDDEFNEGFNG
jgi:hypothetical protein